MSQGSDGLHSSRPHLPRQERVDAQEAPRTSQAGSEEATSAQEAPDEEVASSAEIPGTGEIERGASLGLDGCHRPGLVAFLDAMWTRDLEGGQVAYGLDDARVLAAGPFRFHFIPGRSARPGSWNSRWVPPAGVLVDHQPCPFDGPEIVEEREFARIERGGREYQLVSNRFPVTAPHFLGVKPFATDEGGLRQCLHGVEELVDLLLFGTMLGAGFRVFFNSNRGADGSHAGSSINHWHAQFFPYHPGCRSPVSEGQLAVESEAGGGAARRGTLLGWDAKNITVDMSGGAEEAAASLLWESLEPVHSRRSAYNLEIQPLESGAARAVLYPRAPAANVTIPGVGVLETNFGGWELSGDFVIPSAEVFSWLRDHPDEARAIAERRLAETTRSG